MPANQTPLTTSAQRLPALEENRYLRFGAFALLYAAQGLPWGLFIVAVPAWLAGQGFGAAEIGTFVAIAALPWSFKLVAGPFMDRFTFLAMGRRRPWVLGAQLGILVGMLLLASAPALDENIMLIAWVGFLINAFCALQDVAVDGMAIDILPENERARANAFMYGGQVAGISGASAGGTYLLSSMGLGAAAIVIALAIVLLMMVPLLLRERPGERLLPWSAGSASAHALSYQSGNITAIFRALHSALVMPMSLLLVLCAFLDRAAGGMFIALTPVATVQEMGWADTDYSNWQATGGLIAAVFGVVIAPWIDRRGASVALIGGVLAKIVLLAAAGLFTRFWTEPAFFEALIVLYNATGQVVTIALIALFMNICAHKVAATQFAVYMASSNLAFPAGSAAVAMLAGRLETSEIFLVAAVMNAGFLLLWPMFNLENHKVRMQQKGLDLPQSDPA